ncbi:MULTISPECIES: DUF6264 family protein [Bacteria]|uniref:DUF6264 family protein n=1 Tax=Bacteria TaxID=2 RepID=UPI003C7B4DCA
MSEPRPQFGEYASPEEQSRRAGREFVPTNALAPGVTAPSSVAASPPGRAVVGAHDADTNGAADTTAERPVRPIDRAATIALLAYGLVNVILTVISYRDVPRLMDQSLEMLGVGGKFTSFEAGRTWGTIASVVLIAGWTVTAAWAVTWLRRRRLTWWIPVVGAVVFTIAAAICLTVPMFGDPAFVSYLDTIRGG